MSAPVDVLAVLDAEVATLRRLESWVNEALAPTNADAAGAIARMEDARAAVADLVEALQDILADMESVAPKYRCAASIAQARAALARVGGAK